MEQKTRRGGRVFGFIENSVVPAPASSRVKPLPQESHKAQSCAVPVGAGLPAKRPVKAVDQLPATVIRSISTDPV